jgi:4-amino-4-deoxy-L-arabinose transferase-like glycosyltransferase
LKNQHKYFLLLLIGIFILIISPQLLSKGMFLDGIIYAAISENLSLGNGSFWHLKYIGTAEDFIGHPPLAMYLHSFFFKLFGSAHYVDKLYGLLMFLLTSLTAIQVFKKMSPKYANTSPLVVFFFISIPMVMWSTVNNMLENTVALFTTLAVYFLIQIEKNYLRNAVIAGVCLYLGFLSKGLVALFPLSVPFWLLVFKKSSIKTSVAMLLTAISSILFIALIVHVIEPDSTSFLKHYFQEQIINSVEQIVTVSTRFQILLDYFSNILIGIGIVLVILIRFRFKWHTYELKKGLMIFCIALSGVVPIMISMKQSGFYSFPAMPITAVALAVITAPYLQNMLEKIYSFSFLKLVSIALLVVGIASAIYFKNTVFRDEELLHDFEQIHELLGEQNVLQVNEQYFTDWKAFAYFYRFHKVSLGNNPQGPYFMISSQNTNYNEVVYKGNVYSLVKN